MRFCLPIFIAMLSLATIGCRETATKRFQEQELLSWRAYCTNDIHGAEAALEEYERLVRTEGRQFYQPGNWSNVLGLIQVRRSIIHSRRGDQTGAQRFMKEALVLMRADSNTNVTPQGLTAAVERLDRVGNARWRSSE